MGYPSYWGTAGPAEHVCSSLAITLVCLLLAHADHESPRMVKASTTSTRTAHHAEGKHTSMPATSPERLQQARQKAMQRGRSRRAHQDSAGHALDRHALTLLERQLLQVHMYGSSNGMQVL